MATETVLKYTGDDGQFLRGIPARDLTDEDLDQLAERAGTTPAPLRKTLLSSGLYAEQGAKSNKE